MDTSDPDIKFDYQGICNHCGRYDEIRETRIIADVNKPRELARMAEKIKGACAARKAGEQTATTPEASMP